MDKRHLAFWAICLAILLVWGLLFRPSPKPAQENPTPTEQAETSGQGEQPADTTTDEQPDTITADTTTPDTEAAESTEPTEATATAETGETTEGDETPEAIAFEEQTFELANPFATFQISTKGGVVRQVTMETKVTSPDHTITIHGDEKYAFCDDDLPPRMLPLAINAEAGSALDLAEAEFKNVTPAGADRHLVLRHENKAFAVTKEFTLPEEGYRLQVTLTFEAKTDKVSLPAFQLQVAAVTPVDAKHAKGDTVITVNTGGYHKLTVATEKKSPIAQSAQVLRWAAVSNRYFTAVLDARGPEQNGEIQAKELISTALFLRYADEEKKQKIFADGLSVAMDESTLTKGQARTFELALYVGPKEHSRLRELGYSKVMGTSFLAPISGALMAVLNFIYGFIPNYGVAIILLTALIKLLLFPLDRRSFKSMKEMQRIQPLIKQLQEKFKDDKQKLQIEQMKLFREHKVNPLGGCLPMLLQFPVLYAMFTMLRGAIELWRAPFVGHITDLSQPDTLFTIPSLPLIGSLPVHILPVLMTVFTILSQRIRGGAQATDPQQKMMSQMMPILFLFIFYSFPAGLNLYWLFSTVFGFGAQLVVQRGDNKPQLTGKTNHK
ncbi:MAG: membrane protein insertase YidC [Verrucomicrobia bacterium]|nr:membrane protein insertase YidC [Verrucomicrobiota bacterium]